MKGITLKNEIIVKKINVTNLNHFHKNLKLFFFFQWFCIYYVRHKKNYEFVFQNLKKSISLRLGMAKLVKYFLYL